MLETIDILFNDVTYKCNVEFDYTAPEPAITGRDPLECCEAVQEEFAITWFTLTECGSNLNSLIPAYQADIEYAIQEKWEADSGLYDPLD